MEEITDEEVVSLIKDGLISRLEYTFGYCGVMEAENLLIFNSGNGNIKIKIEWD